MKNPLKKVMTICCVHSDKEILLGQIKKDGVLKGKYNGFGGKVEKEETVDEAAERELFEECCIKPLDMRKRGKIIFDFQPDGNPFEGKPQIEVHIYSVTNFEGTPQETNEMKPQWFTHDKIPYDNMWPDDKFWLPLLLAGKNFEASFSLADPQTILSHEIIELS